MTMSPQEVEQLVEDLYAATAVGDWDKTASMLTEDFFVTEAPGLPMEGIYRGQDALKQLFVKVMEMLDVAALDRVQTTTGGDFAITILTMRFADPELEPVDLCEMFRFRDGKVCEIKPYYFDPAPVIAAAGAKKIAQH